MPRPLMDLLWRDHPRARSASRRGPRARVSTGAVVAAATQIADEEGLTAVTVRRLAADLGLSTMSVYTYVNSRDDLLVLMVDEVHARMDRPDFGRTGWRRRVRRIADANLRTLRDHRWLHDVMDERVALGPGTIAKYDYELGAVLPLGLGLVASDAALTFVLDFVRASARAFQPGPGAGELAAHWQEWGPRLAAYVGTDFPAARAVGAAAGEAMGGPASPSFAWEFGLGRVLDGLAALTPGDPGVHVTTSEEARSAGPAASSWRP